MCLCLKFLITKLISDTKENKVQKDKCRYVLTINAIDSCIIISLFLEFRP